jgi:hypothetical protein
MTTSASAKFLTRTYPASARHPAITSPSAIFVEHPKLLINTFALPMAYQIKYLEGIKI